MTPRGPIVEPVRTGNAGSDAIELGRRVLEMLLSMPGYTFLDAIGTLTNEELCALAAVTVATLHPEIPVRATPRVLK